MWQALKPYYIELLKIAWDDASAEGLVQGAFDLENVNVQRVLEELAQRVVGIDETTRDIIQMVIGRQASEGWTIEQVRDELLSRAVTDSANRAELIALTETADAMERGNHLAWAASGVVKGSTWLLGPNPCDDCLPLGGKTVPLGEEFAPGVTHPPFHPRCTCATAAEVDW